ncbi:MAG: FG-GAP-like repeat-containing protein [Thermoplasmatota archaeon]
MASRSIRLSIVSLTVLAMLTAAIPSGEHRIMNGAEGVEDPQVPLFLNVSSEAGLSGVRGDSFAWGDYNDDGYQDLLVKGSRLFRNGGPPDYHFTEVTEDVGLVNSGYSVWGDLDNDGYLDIFSVGHPYEWPDSVWINEGPPNFGFSDVSSRSGPNGVDDGSPGLAAALGDLDRDGDLDAYVVNWRDDDNVKYEDVLWENTGNGVFRDITVQAGIVDWNDDRGEPNAGMGVNMGDYNNDGWLDIYVSNYLITPNYLWENQGDMTFLDVAIGKGAAGEQSRTPQETYYGHTAGSQWADFDNDGDLDMWSSNLAHKDPYRTLICADSELLRNDGSGSGYSFTNVRDETGIPTNVLGNEELFFGIAWGDFDNDGDLDMWIPQIKNYIDYAYSYLFRNNGDGTFTDVSDEAGFRVWDSDGGAWCDYDNDGDLDLVTEGKYPYENATYETRLYQNQGSGVNSYLNVRLRGTRSESSGIGARIYAQDPENHQFIAMREVEGGTAGHSYVPSLVQEFGLGDRKGVVDLEIRWPTGTVQFVNDAGINSEITVREPEAIDLAVETSVTPDSVLEGEQAKLRITLNNIGDSDIRECTVSIFEQDDPDSGWSRGVDIGTIDSGDSYRLEIGLDTLDMDGDHDIQVRLVSSFPPDENPVNDVSSVTLDVERSNSAPVIRGIEADPMFVMPGEASLITVSATDQDGDLLFYEFDSAHGSFEFLPDRQDQVLWTAPAAVEIQTGLSARIDVEVSDGMGGTAAGRIEITVVEPMIPPSILDLRASPDHVSNDGSGRVVITAEVADNGGIEGIDSVEADLSGFGGSASEPMNDAGSYGDQIPNDGVFTLAFNVPAWKVPGEYRINVTVIDKQDLTAAGSVVVVVSADDSHASKPGSGGGFQENGYLFLFGAVILILIVFAAIYLIVRIGRRFGKEEQTV